MTDGFTEQREGRGRRMADGEVVAVVESSFLRRFAGWFIAVGAALSFAAGAWAMNVDNDIDGLGKDLELLKESQFTDTEAANMTGEMKLLRLEMVNLRREMERQ